MDEIKVIEGGRRGRSKATATSQQHRERIRQYEAMGIPTRHSMVREMALRQGRPFIEKLERRKQEYCELMRRQKATRMREMIKGQLEHLRNRVTFLRSAMQKNPNLDPHYIKELHKKCALATLTEKQLKRLDEGSMLEQPRQPQNDNPGDSSNVDNYEKKPDNDEKKPLKDDPSLNDIKKDSAGKAQTDHGDDPDAVPNDDDEDIKNVQTKKEPEDLPDLDLEDDSDIEIMPAPTPPIPDFVDLEAEEEPIDNIEEVEPRPNVRNEPFIDDIGRSYIRMTPNVQDQIRIWPRVRFLENQPLRFTIQLRDIQGRTYPGPQAASIVSEMARPPPPAISPMSSTTTSTRSLSPNTSFDSIGAPNEPDKDPPTKVKKEESKDDPFKPPKVPSWNNSPFALNRDQPWPRQAIPVSPSGKITKRQAKRIRASVLGKLKNSFVDLN